MSLDLKRVLDDVLEGVGYPNPAVAALADVAESLRMELVPQVPQASQQRALFAAGVAARRARAPWVRLAVPALATMTLMVAAASVASQALPGDALYRVRQVLSSVGLATTPTDEIDSHIVEGIRLVEAAEAALLEGDVGLAADRALAAVSELENATELLPGLDPDQRTVRTIAIESLELRALTILDAVTDSDENKSGEDRSNGGPGPGRLDEEGADSGPGSNNDPEDSNEGSGDSSGPDEDSDDRGDADGDGDDRSGPDSDDADDADISDERDGSDDPEDPDDPDDPEES